ncbi:MAG: prolipoprotein diacylglyceryl transferase [Rickettsiales bacterium]|jgi:phosphatidylglycerol:prolipoprotein diacylglycerol transferase|nr:prolipoprotein diacylglyceryl transferase [Rickettsiales bacterium]
MNYLQLPVFNPNALSVGFLQIRWYSLAYIVPLLLSWFVLKFFNEKYNLNLYKDASVFSDDYLFYAVLGILVGGRLGYVMLYNPNYYIQNPMEIVEIWKGGMSFHGGFIGSVLALYLICKKHNSDFSTIADICTISASIAIFCGRIANFINLELYGRVTQVRWAMIFPFTDGQPRHPSQLYEAFAEGIIIFLVMIYVAMRTKLKVKCLNSALFLTLYGVFRIIIECFREPDMEIGFLANHFTLGQILSLPILCFGCFLLYKTIKNNTSGKLKRLKKH